MTINIELTAMLCAKPDTGWYFFRGKSPDGTTHICKGRVAWQPAERETLELTGDFVLYKGERHFQFNSARLALPDNPRAELHYCIDRAAGCGPALERAIWETCGEAWRGCIGIVRMTTSQRLALREQILAFGAQKEKANTLGWLEARGCTAAMAAAAYERWGSGATGVVSSDPYRLAELPHYSWQIVDRNIRPNFDIGDTDPRRISAGIMHAAVQCGEDGSTAFPAAEHLRRALALLPGVPLDLLHSETQRAINDGRLVLFGTEDRQYLATAAAHETELGIVDFIQQAFERSAEQLGISVPSLALGEAFEPDEAQMRAVSYAVHNHFAIINGGAGTGKTSVIRMIARGTKSATNLTVHLCAPTGKAAARLKEATGMPASTIHSMLGAQGDGRFLAGDLTADAVIVDEASMVDSALMAELTKRRPARLVLVGDQAQLTPVGAGQPFHDLIRLFPPAVMTLEHCYRAQEAVYSAASLIRNGDAPGIHAKSEREEWVVTRQVSGGEAQSVVCDLARQGWLDFSRDIVLCPRNGKRTADGWEPSTVNGLNAALLLIDRERRGGDAGEKWLAGDRVINTVNRPDKHVWNGTTGEVVYMSDAGDVCIRLDEPYTDERGRVYETVTLDKDEAGDLQYAYALTVHKSQGSQYRRVVLVALSRDEYQLDRAMIYTGVTRTRETCVVLGSYSALLRGIDRVEDKTTVLQVLGGQI